VRTPSKRMYAHTVLVERREEVPDPLDGNVPLADWTTVIDDLPAHVTAVDASEGQVLGTVEVPITYKIMVPSDGSVVRDGDRITISGVTQKVIVEHKINIGAKNKLYLVLCHDEP